ncbi:heptaprenyl diphosphate synthase component 1 [Fredinandcohnia sp. 179-A 10B2 NHS]|uniref:heptaprenyl diphosphate synthase component 1 n=1 Tax=Fredinandcohnia sp. 179-A 10B2 NHS TaxID=3235176 RepID=UPI0039A0A211
MIDLQDIKNIIADLKELIEGKLKHSYLEKYIDAPHIDEDRILLLYSIYEDLKLPKEQLENYIVTTMLVHQALETHETVPNQNKSGEYLRNQQLKVLAGDYFSGLYYYFLAQTRDIELIRTLAEGIKEVNESKIYLYQKDNEQVNKLFSCIENIETAIIRKIVEKYEMKKWFEISSAFLLLKRLVHERELFLRSGTSILFESLINILFPKQEVHLMQVNMSEEQEEILIREFERQLDNVICRVEKVVNSNVKINELLKTRMTEILRASSSITMNKIVEEG